MTLNLLTSRPVRRFALGLAAAFCAADVAAEVVDEIVVTSMRRPQPILAHIGNIDRLGREQFERARHQHLHELLSRISGVWLSRGSGQENLTAIRSPVLTGAGSCGAFLTLEDGMPTRPAGFCNDNQLFEINAEQARAIEIIRGPGNALYGSNALHGIINVADTNFADRADYAFGQYRYFPAAAGSCSSSWLTPRIAYAPRAQRGGSRESL